METKLKHLEFIQNTINRMAKNSFLLKGWAITIIGGLLAFSIKEMDCLYVLVSLVILIFFWLLDGYYLYQEKLYIKLYDHVRQQSVDKIDFSMATDYFKKDIDWKNCFFSKTMLLFYGGLLIVHVIIRIIKVVVLLFI